ncbi:DUF1471 domain-containing protein, partial [Vibrio fortis]
MNKIILIVLSLVALGGCVTRKVPVMPEAKSIGEISEVAIRNLQCEMIDTYTLADSHPNNVTP